MDLSGRLTYRGSMFPGRSMSSPAFVAVGLLGLSAALLPAPTVVAADKVVAADRGEVVPLHKNWKLVWQDDFSKDKEIDKTKWNLVVKGDGFGNNEQEFYTDRKDNVK